MYTVEDACIAHNPLQYLADLVPNFGLVVETVFCDPPFHDADWRGYQTKTSLFLLVLPEIAEPLGRKFAISNRMLDVLVAKIVLQRSSIHTLIGQLEPS